MDKIKYNVIFFFKKALNKKIDENSFINDFCKDEDDAFYLFLEFFEKFEIKTGNFNLDKYFNSNNTFWDIIFKKNKTEYKIKPKIPISHLIEVAIKKEWFDVKN